MSINVGNRSDNYLLFNGEDGSIEIEKEDDGQVKVGRNSKTSLMFMLFYNLTYLWSNVLELSPMISSGSHIKSTPAVFAYDFLFINMLCYGLFSFSDVNVKRELLNYKRLFLYGVFCLVGGLGFALLGEVPYLKHFSIVPGFWKHLDFKAKVTILFFTCVIVGLMFKEAVDSIKKRLFKHELVRVLEFVWLYGTVLFYLTYFNASSVQYHIHHAILATFLSLFFLNWENTIEMLMHAVLMGVLVEGIDFYGIGELYLFMTKTGPVIPFDKVFISSVYISILYILGMVVTYIKLDYWETTL